MFNKKRKLPKYLANYGKSPSFKRKSLINRILSKEKHFPPRKSLRSGEHKLKRILTAITFILAAALIVYTAFFSGYFTVTEIYFTNKNISKQPIAEKIKKIISDSLGKNLITIDLSIFETRILNKFPEIQEIDVSKNYPSSIEIDFKEYPMTANVILEGPTMKKNYIINSIGYAVKEDMENKSLPYIRLKSDEPLNTDTRMIEQSNLKYMLDSATYFQDKFGMRIVEIRYKKTAREIHLLTEKDFSIWLDIQRPFEDQLKKLKKALVKLDIYKENLSYIDLRIAGESGDKIIYKRK